MLEYGMTMAGTSDLSNEVELFDMCLGSPSDISLSSLDSDSDIELIYMYTCLEASKKKRKRKMCVRENREQHSGCSILFKQLSNDEDNYFHFFRMTKEHFQVLLEKVGPLIEKQDTSFRKALSAEEKLCLTLRYCASGDLQHSLTYAFRMGPSTVSNIIEETCEAIWTALQPLYLAPPDSFVWRRVAQEFMDLRHFPNCIGAIDGKHVLVHAPANTGSEYFNCKKSFSLVLLAICDAHYCFVLVDIGAMGHENDRGVFGRSAFGKALEENTLQIPPPSQLPNSTLVLPHVLVGDAGFPLRQYLMRPYPGKQLPQDKSIFNYRLSRARRAIDNCFGILAARWRIFHCPINTNMAGAIKIVKACICLHNFLQSSEMNIPANLRRYCPPHFVDYETPTGEVINGEWRNFPSNGIASLGRVGSNSYAQTAKTQRNKLKEYFISPQGRVPWQDKYVMCG